MITANNINIIFDGMGFFHNDDEWIHPQRIEDTYEIIYVTNGTVYLKEGDSRYAMTQGDLLILEPFTVHEGYQVSTDITSFYWLHFYCNDFSQMPICGRFFHHFEKNYLFKELLHHWCTNNEVLTCEILLLYILSELFSINYTMKSRLASDAFSYVRTNASASLTAEKVGDFLKYNSEHVSRVVKKTYGYSLKELINRNIISSINNYLSNTTLSIKEIANILDFKSSNALTHFYKYHENITPLEYRRKYFMTKMNKK